MRGGRSARWYASLTGAAVVIAVSLVGLLWPRAGSGPVPPPSAERATNGAVEAVEAVDERPDRASSPSNRSAAAGPALWTTGAEAAGPTPESSPRVCPFTEADRALAGEDRHRRIVDFVYCSMLDRAPDTEGTAYWSGQLAAGLGVDDLVVQVAGSAEYRERRAGRARWEPSPLQALTALIPAAGERPAPERATTPDDVGSRATSADGLRVRQPLTAVEFGRWVADRGLAEVDHVTDALIHGRIVGGGQRVNVVYVHRSATRNLRVSPGGRGRATVGTWAREIGADVAINGNWYGPWDGPAVSGGRVYGGSDHGYTALFGVTADGDVVLEHHRDVNEGVDPRIVDGVSGHPTLVDRGQRTTDFGTDPTFLNRHPRTAIGIDASGDILILVTVDGRSSVARGMTGGETAELMERLGARDAVMLDGGGSSTMWIAGRGVVNQPSGGLRAVGNQVAVFGS